MRQPQLRRFLIPVHLHAGGMFQSFHTWRLRRAAIRYEASDLLDTYEANALTVANQRAIDAYFGGNVEEFRRASLVLEIVRQDVQTKNRQGVWLDAPCSAEACTGEVH